ncbi:hypothetical protein VaNZ11_006922 [Volvox africanus]|uniref:Uncharacterized protein n=1 Tax=Volvox africanus TaxID=51714 RepID=A0ABQ5S2V9_9CHLO|nr:hypothetical protein VaNZ11_006922 [Volvox africanus]
MPIKCKVKPTIPTRTLIINIGKFYVNPCTMGWRQDRLLQSFWIVVFFNGVLQWSSSVYAAESILPGATVVCSITLTGEPKSTTSINTGAWMPAFFRIQCNSTGHSQTRVTIGLGEQLMRYAPPADGICGSPPSSPTSNAGSPPPYTSGTGAGGDAWRETHSTVSLPAPEGLTDSFDPLSPTSPISPPLIPPSVTPPPFPLMVGTECFVESLDEKDWGITFTDQIEHLELRDSVIQGAPLSYQPLIRCPNCKYVTLVNVTVRDLHGKNLSIDDSCKGRTVGALYFGGVQGAIVDQLTCVNVKGATDFACLWFGLTSTDVDSSNKTLSEAAFFRISNSAFMNNSITKGDCIEDDGSERFGFGSVVFYAIDAVAMLGSVEVFGTTMYDIEGGFGSAVSFVTRDGNLLHMDVFNISGSNFTHNKAAKHGGAVFINVRTSLDLLHVTQSSKIDNNTAGYNGNGGAFYIAPLIESLVVEGTSSVSANSADLSGGAFYFEKGIKNISILRGSNVSGNRAFENGGAFCIREANVNSISVEDNSHVDHNTVDVNVRLVSNGGGAFHLQDVSLKQFVLLNGSSMDNNMLIGTAATRRPGSGGALRVDGHLDTLVVRQNSSISNNTAGAGGGVFVARGIPGGIQVLEGSRIDNNSATGRDVDVQKPDGGGIMVTLDCPNVTVMDWSSISGNMAARGGGVFIGGGLQKLVVKRGSKMSRNFATQGGAAIGVGLLCDGSYMVTDLVEVSEESCICNNSASTPNNGSYYGAMYFGKTRVTSFTITNGSCVCGNKVAFGDGFGGAVYADNGFVNFTVCHNSGLSDNMGGNGGAVHFPDHNGQPVLSLERFELCNNSHMDGNQARTSGGALYMAGTVGQIIFSNSSISHNRANNTGGALALWSMFQSFSIGDALVYNNSVKFDEGGFLSCVMAPDDITTTSKSEVDDPTAADLSKYHLPSNGPFYFNIIRTNISGNTAMKDGGAIAFDLRIMMSNVYNDTLRAQLQKGQVLYIFITDTSWNDNWAQYGAGGALAFLSITPFIADEKRLASVLLGARINIKNSTFTTNRAGDNMKRFPPFKDISSLRGNGGAIFIRAEPYPLFSDSTKLSATQSSYIMYDDDRCDTVENGLIPGIDAFEDLFCWPRGSQACGILLDGVILAGNLATGGFGGGLLTAHCAAKIINSTFYNNSATLDGGGLAFMDYDLPTSLTTSIDPSISNNDRSNNNKDSSNTASPRYPQASNLLSTVSKEALQNVNMSKPLQRPWLFLHRTAFTRNTAADGGGAFLEVNTTAAVILDCILTDNIAVVEGGGVMLTGASNFSKVIGAFRGTHFMNNRAGTAGGGAAVRLAKSMAVAVLLDCTFEVNSATRGGGLFNSGVKGSSLLVWNCSIVDNNANYGGGVDLDYVYVNATAADFLPDFSNILVFLLPPAPPSPSPPPPPPPGGEVFIPKEALVHFLQCNVSGNRALVQGGGINMAADRADINRQTVLALLEQNTINFNDATRGGGIWFSATNSCMMRVSNCSVLDNTAQLEGGGAYSTTKCGGQLLVGNGSLWIGNSAGLYGGAIMVVSADDITGSNNTANVSGDSMSSTSSDNMLSKCSDVGLNVSDATVTDNSAGEGGGIFASNKTAIAIWGAVLRNNEAGGSGGAVAAVNCHLLKIFNSSIINNQAASSGGGIFTGKCAIFIMELGQLTHNQASTGGGIHIDGISAGLIDSPIAILSCVDLDQNTASVGFGQHIEAALSWISSSPSSAAASNLQSYQGYGGAIFVSGHVGVAVSNSTAGPENYANVGTVLATTQTCSSLGSHNETQFTSGPGTVVAQLAKFLAKEWLDAVTALSQAGNVGCSLLVLMGTKLPWSTQSSPPVNVQQQADRTRKPSQPSLIWLQDLRASSLLANCTPSSSSSSSSSNVSMTTDEQEEIAGLVRQRMGSTLTTTTPGSVNFPVEGYEDDQNLLSALIKLMQDCLSTPTPSPILAVPATHMRLISFNGVLLVPAKGGNGSSGSSGENPTQMPSNITCTACGPYLSSIDDGSTFRGKDIEVLIVRPDTFFNLRIQLYDGLGQPVTVEIPTFLVSLRILPNPADATSVSADDKFALLLKEGLSVINQTFATEHGVVSWTALEMLGWPGKYVLEATAVILGTSANPSSVQKVTNLQIHVELLPCEVGAELVQGISNGADAYSCSICRRDQVGLWTDRRLPLSKLLSSNLSDGAWQSSRAANKILTDRSTNGKESSCPSCCQACPTNAICPSGALLLPAPGYWHSAPNSPRMHRCPQSAACGKVDSFGDALDGFWSELLAKNFNTTILQNVILNITDPSYASIVGSSDLPAATTLQLLGSVLSTGNNNRSLLLAVCQQWWYKTFPPNRDNVLQQQYNIPRLTKEEELPCYLFNDDPSTSSIRPQGSSGNRSYLQLQCATGYTGHLCAACLPGYSLSVDFSCMKCPSLARTIVVGILAFWGTVALILLTTFSNMSLTRSAEMAAEELSSLDRLKTLITHVQYFIIITKLSIDYPPIITKYQSVLSSFVSMENFIAYSPSCLFEDLGSAGQAATQITFAFGAPCTATLVSLVLWTIRYLTANQAKLSRQNKAARRRTLRRGLRLVGVFNAQEESSVQPTRSCIAVMKQKWRMVSTSKLDHQVSVTADQDIPGGMPQQGGTAEISIQLVGSTTGVGSGAGAGAAVAVTSISAVAGVITPGAGADDREGGNSSTTAVGVHHQGVSQQLSPQPQQPLSPSFAGGGIDITATTTTTPTSLLPVASGASIGNMHQQATTCSSSTPMTPTGGPKIINAKLQQQPTAATPTSQISSLHSCLQVPPLATCTPTNATGSNTNVGSNVSSDERNENETPWPQQLTPSPFLSGPPLSPASEHVQDAVHCVDSEGSRGDQGEQRSIKDPEQLGWFRAMWYQLRHATVNPLRLLLFADQSVTLSQQLGVVAIVASFILYPSLCQISLGIFACYIIDPASGAFKENQKATWSHGYWVRNMQQECYAGVHKRVYVPIGIATVLLFCFCPPIIYLILTARCRRNFNNIRIRIQYGFLYQQYNLDIFLYQFHQHYRHGWIQVPHLVPLRNWF